jgi:hypothetical protein
MAFHVGDTVRFAREFYEDPYLFVPSLEVYEKLDVSGGGENWSRLLEAARPVVTRIIISEAIIYVKYRLEGYNFNIETCHFPEELELIRHGEEYEAQLSLNAKEREAEKRRQYSMTLFDLMERDDG